MISIELRPDWFKHGLCWGRPQVTSLFFPDDEEGGCAQGRQYCERCPVRQNCLNYAIDNGIYYGLWGGLTYRERERYKRNPAAFVLKKATCEECGELLTGKRRLFCSTRCVRKASSKRKRQNTRLAPAICEMCGGEFVRHSTLQILCSDKCRKDSANLRTSRNRNEALRTVGCLICGAVNPSAYAKYCSAPCRLEARKTTLRQAYEKRKFAS